MSISTLTNPTVSLPPITYKGQPVITTEVLAKAYGCDPKQIRQNLSNNKNRFIEGKHYFYITGQELKNFRDYVENFDIVIPPRTRHFTLYTESGSLYHAKSIGTDEAWAVYDVLVETFFRVVGKEPQPATTDSPLTPDQQATIKNIVKALVDKGGIYANIYSRFNNHFRLGSYKQLPQCKMGEAITYLMGLDVGDKGQKALSEQPALPAPQDTHRQFQNAVRIKNDELKRAMYKVGDIMREYTTLIDRYGKVQMQRNTKHHTLYSAYVNTGYAMDDAYVAYERAAASIEHNAKVFYCLAQL